MNGKYVEGRTRGFVEITLTAFIWMDWGTSNWTSVNIIVVWAEIGTGNLPLHKTLVAAADDDDNLMEDIPFCLSNI
jgi:hypothetical protein